MHSSIPRVIHYILALALWLQRVRVTLCQNAPENLHLRTNGKRNMYMQEELDFKENDVGEAPMLIHVAGETILRTAAKIQTRGCSYKRVFILPDLT